MYQVLTLEIDPNAISSATGITVRSGQGAFLSSHATQGTFLLPAITATLAEEWQGLHLVSGFMLPGDDASLSSGWRSPSVKAADGVSIALRGGADLTPFAIRRGAWIPVADEVFYPLDELVESLGLWRSPQLQMRVQLNRPDVRSPSPVVKSIQAAFYCRWSFFQLLLQYALPDALSHFKGKLRRNGTVDAAGLGVSGLAGLNWQKASSIVFRSPESGASSPAVARGNQLRLSQRMPPGIRGHVLVEMPIHCHWVEKDSLLQVSTLPAIALSLQEITHEKATTSARLPITSGKVGGYAEIGADRVADLVVDLAILADDGFEAEAIADQLHGWLSQLQRIEMPQIGIAAPFFVARGPRVGGGALAADVESAGIVMRFLQLNFPHIPMGTFVN